METPDPLSVFDAHLASKARAAMPTSLGTAELRDLGAEILARSTFTARGINAIYASKLKESIDRMTAGELSEGQVRTALYETLDLLGYDVEKGGFPGEELEPALKGTLQDLRSFRRMNLVVRTQMDLMQGAGEKMRGSMPDMLSEFPAWELVRVMDVTVPRDWPSRWQIAGGTLRADGRMIALKGDPIWGELGAYENFPDALGVDHPPFAFNSGMGWKNVSANEIATLSITGPNGESADEFLATQPVTLTGKQPLPTPQVSLAGVDPAIIDRFKKAVKAESGDKPYVFDYSDLLAADLKAADAAYRKGKTP